MELNEYLEYAEESKATYKHAPVSDHYREILIDFCKFPVKDLVKICGEQLLPALLEWISEEHLNIGYEWDDTHPEKVDWGYCAHAAKVLGKIGDKRAVKPLIEMFGLWSASWDGHEKAAIAALANIGKPAVRPLITALGAKDSEFRIGRDVRACAVKALVKIGEPSVKLLTKALERKNEDVSKAAKLALEKIK
jgi:HEAT repeat protein